MKMSWKQPCACDEIAAVLSHDNRVFPRLEISWDQYCGRYRSRAVLFVDKVESEEWF